MASQITSRPPFEPPIYFKKTHRWSKRTIPDGYSDGDQRHWPGAPAYRPSPDEFYLCVLGQKWAEKDGIAQPGIQYYIERLPDGYGMFETDQPGGPQTYKRLFGHPSGRFYDSAPKFTPHFLWLMSGMDGSCDCIHCLKNDSRPMIPRPRAPRETIDRSILYAHRSLRDLTEDDDDTESSREISMAGIPPTKRTQRQVRQAGTAVAVDEEATEDVYKDCVKKLENAKGGSRGLEIDLTEDGSIDWKAERACLPQHLTQIELQHCFIPRIGELVLWCPDFLDQHYLMQDPQTSQYKFYSFEQKSFHGFPAWRGGLVASTPSAKVKNGPIDFTDLLDVPEKKTSINTAGFRIETFPDPNDDMNKAMSKQYRYVHLRNIRPLSHWQMLLKDIPKNKLHPSIEYALTCMTSISLLEKWRFNGDWPNARIFCKGIYLGSELLTLGDTIRLLPSNPKGDLRPEVLVVDSIRYNLLDMQLEHTRPENPNLCKSSYISFVGSAYTTDLRALTRYRTSSGIKQDLPVPLESSDVKTIFRSVGANEYGQWYLWHGHGQKYEVSHEQVLGRLYEADAVRLWTCQRQHETQTNQPWRSALNYDVGSILAARQYAAASDARLPEPQSSAAINWFFADTRAESLAVATINGVDVGRYHDIRTPATLKQWLMQVKVADGQQVAPEIMSEYVRDLSKLQLYSGARRGRPVGSKVVDGKLVFPGTHKPGDDSDDIHELKYKPSSQMAGAALATDHDESSEEYESSEAKDTSATDRNSPRRGQDVDGSRHMKSILSKADIMSSVEIPADRAFDDDISEGELWWEEPLPPARGGTEESEGGDYKE